MANLRVSVLQHVICKGSQFPQATQKRWAQVHDVRFLATQPANQIFEKYREKLGRKAKEYE
jgi:ATP synthase mitochondrial F1 complex assembly factor 1